MSQRNDLEKIFIFIEKSIPKNNIINGLIMYLRIIPLFLLTHDWNIQYKNSITYYISYITTLPLIHKSNAQKISLGIVIFLFIFSLISIIFLFKLYKQYQKFHKITNPISYKIKLQIMYWINFIFSPYNFMYCFENFFCTPNYDNNVNYKLIKTYNNECRNFSNIFTIIFQIILIVYLFIINIFFSFIIAKPCCFTSSLIITKLNEIKFKLAFFPFFQSIIVLDFYLPLKICVLIKSIIRAFYIWYYISFISFEIKNYFTNFYYRLSIIFIDTMCFISCIIEYIFLFDYKNNFEYLQEDGTIICFKLIIEATLSIIVLQIFCIKETKITVQFFDGKISHNYSYELLNKIFYIFSHPEKAFGTDILYEIVESFDSIFKIHKYENKCQKYPGIKCYCSKYSYKDFVEQSEKYLEVVNEIRIGKKFEKKNLKIYFPIMYKYIENNIKIQIIKNKGNYNNDYYLLILAFFYIIFDINYNKGLFYLEEFSTTKFYQTNKITKFQCKLIKLVMLNNYQNYLISKPEKSHKEFQENSFIGIYKVYSKISKIILIENYLNQILDIFIDSLNIYKEKDCSFSQFKKLLNKFKISINRMNKTLINTFLSNIISSYHLCAKLTIFYSFFYLELPKNINKCFKNIFEITCEYENYSTFILKTIINKNNWKFIFEYTSDNFCLNLGYNLEELKNTDINELFPDSLKKPIEFSLLEKIRKGNNQIILKEIILFDKDKHALLFNLIGIVVFDGDKLKLFFKVYHYNFKLSFKSYSKNNSSLGYIFKKKNLGSIKKEECWIFINKNGKIFAISEIFERYFCLNLNTLKKYKINLFKDILKIEGFGDKEIFKKNLAQVYENIALINFNIMQNSSNEEFTKTYKRIKEIQTLIFRNINSNLICMIEKREMAKSNKEIKEYYLIYIIIESNKSYITFESLFGKNNMINQNLTFPTKTKIGEFLGSVSKTNKKIFLKKFEINKNKNEILIKIRQTQILSIKQLTSNYNLKLSDVLDLTIKEIHEFNQYNNIVDKETNRLISNNSINSNTSFKQTNSNNNIFESIDYIDKFFKLRTIEEHFSFINKKNNSFFLIYIYLLIVIWVFVTISFIFFQSISLFFSYQQLEKEGILSDILINSLITRNIIYSFITSLLSMQYIVNGLHNNIIDNGFTNTIPYHKEKIYDRVKDFLYFFKIFERQEKYLCDYNEIEAINVFFQELDYISVKTDNLLIKHSLNSILANSHLHAYEVIESELEPFLFNISYYDIYHRELLGESAFFQFVFDNYLCNGKYSWDEMDNIIYKHIEKKNRIVLYYIYLLYILSGCLFFGTFVIQILFYIKFNNQIFAKYYLNYNYLQFFNSLLLKKALLIREFIRNPEIDNLYKFSQQKIAFENTIEDNNSFKNNYIRINNKIPLVIKPYKIKEEISNDLNMKLGMTKTNTIFLDQNAKESFTENDIGKQTNLIIKIRTQDFSKKQTVDLKTKFSANFLSPSPRKKKKKIKRISNFGNQLNNNNNNNNDNNTTEKKLVKKTKEDNFLNLLNEISEIQTKKDLIKPKMYILYIIIFSISIILIISLFITNLLLIKKTLLIKETFIFILKGLIESITNAQEIFLIYSITILKGEVMTFKYKSNGYLNAFKELDYINELEEHNIIEEAFAKTEALKSNVFPILNEQYKNFKLLNNYLENINSPGACEYYINFYFENRNTFDFSFLNSFNYDVDEMIQECNNISFGVNSQGITVAAYSLLEAISNNYFEFKVDDNKENNLINRVNNKKFIGMWAEIDLIYDKIILNLIFCWRTDLRNAEKNNFKINCIIYSLIIGIIIIIFLAYLIFFPIKTLKDNDIIIQIESSLYNTIMF